VDSTLTWSDPVLQAATSSSTTRITIPR
jgi:hypothetical protein